MDIQKEREAFEEKFPVPAHWIEFDIKRNKYFCPYCADAAANAYQAQWETWQAAKAQAVPEWNSVDDKEPPLGTMVLICWSDALDVEPEKDYMDHDVDHGVNYWANYNGGDEPSHWMLLPKPVAQEQSHD